MGGKGGGAGDVATSLLEGIGSLGTLASGGADDEAREHPTAAKNPAVSRSGSARPASKGTQLRPNRSTSPSQPRARYSALSAIQIQRYASIRPAIAHIQRWLG